MAQIAKLDFQVDLKSSPERFHKAFSYQQNMLPKMCPEIVKDIQVVKGDWKSVGSIRKWTYAPSDDSASSEVAFLLTEAIDDKNKSATMKIIEGDLLKEYKSYKFSFQAFEKGNGSLVKGTQEYEKANEDVPEPTKYSDFATWFWKAIDAYLVKNA